MPGPGNYMGSTDTFGRDAKGATMGSKYKAVVSDTPGPGQYSGEAKAVKVNCKIGTTKRPDIWEKDVKNDHPGPGNYLESTGTFGKNVKGGASMGSKH